MNILFHAEPGVFHGRPFHYWALLDHFVKMYRCLSVTAAGGLELNFRFTANAALAERAVLHHGIETSAISIVRECDLQDHAGKSSLETMRALHFGADPDLQSRLTEFYREAVNGFRPDVVITFSPAPYWKEAFAGAAVLHVEAGIFSRHPLPHLFFLDHQGLFVNSVLGACSKELKALRTNPVDSAFLAILRAEFKRRIVGNSPFHALETDLRTRFRRLLLLPLQFAGEFGFDLNSPYDRQGSYLLDVVQRVSPDTAVIVTEHPTAIWLGDVIDTETREFVQRKYPNVVFAPGAREGLHHAGQMLLHHVDAVASISSSLGMQAVFFQKPLLALGNSHLRNYASWTDVEAFNGGQDAAVDNWDAALLWMLRRYYISMESSREGNTLYRQIQGLASAPAGPSLAPYSVIAPDERLLGALFTTKALDAA